MTERIFKSMMNKLPAGEYDADDIRSFYSLICPKTYADLDKFENHYRYLQFTWMFEEKKYGFEYMFNGRIRYVGTNDLHSLMVA